MAPDSSQRGSALLVTVLVLAVLTILGVSLLMISQTDATIAESEQWSGQALYLSEAGARQVERWFDHPRSTAHALVFPSPTVVDRSLRAIDVDGDGPAAPIPADGTAERPYYKENIDRNGDGLDDLFDRPFRSSLADTLLGTASGPDVRIDDGNDAGRDFLTELSERLLPSASPRLTLRISRIDVFAPPYLPRGGAPTRHGIATIAVTARVYDAERVVAESRVTAVVNEIPYAAAFGPLHSCGDLSWSGSSPAHWGVVTATGITMLPAHSLLPASLARETPADPRRDRLRYPDPADDARLLAYKGKVESQGGGLEVEDPWFRVVTAGALESAPVCAGATATQPCPFDWDGTSDLGAGQLPSHVGALDGSHSNLFRQIAAGTFPRLDYAGWKQIATGRGSDVHYFTWDSGTAFREDGTGEPRDFRELTDGRTGLFFFDTRDGLAPADGDGDGVPDNLTPAIAVAGGTWQVRGLVYVNAESFRLDGVAGRPVTVEAPGEPFQDSDGNGRYDPGERHVNLAYPASIDGRFRGSATDSRGGAVVRDGAGPAIEDAGSVWGLLYVAGRFDLSGEARLHGSVVAGGGITESTPGAAHVEIYWDQRLLLGWPPEGWDLPRVYFSAWRNEP